MVQAVACLLLRGREAEGRVVDQAFRRVVAGRRVLWDLPLLGAAGVCFLVLHSCPSSSSLEVSPSQTSTHRCSLDLSICSFSFEEKVVFQLSEYSCYRAAMDIFLTSSCKSLLSFYPFVYVCVFPKTYMHVCIFFFPLHAYLIFLKSLYSSCELSEGKYYVF